MKAIRTHFSLLLTLALVACGSASLTQANLDKIHNDMTPAEVKSILGSPTESNSEPIPVVGGTQTTYTYHTDKSEVKIIFKNDQVKEKQGSFGP